MTTENQEVKAPSPDTIYTKVRALAVFSKLLGAFPLKHTLQRDGRKLRHSWLNVIHIWDAGSCAIIMYLFVKSCSDLVAQNHGQNGAILTIWLVLTCYIVAIRGLIQFIIVHFYAPRLPPLFAELEEYHQIIGVNIIKPSTYRHIANIVSMIWTVGILLILETASFSFFSQLNVESIFMDTWPVSISFMFANLWKELPMNMFGLICMYLTARFYEIRDELRKVREKGGAQGPELQTLRLQHACLLRIVSHLQRCYGMQLAVNLLFLLVDVVLQLFVFFAITSSKNVFLLFLAAYYFGTSITIFAIVDKLERTNEILADELAAFDISPDCKDLQVQVQLFMSQLSSRPVKMSASGFYIINNTLVASVIGSVATYLVVLIQFAPYIMNLANVTGLVYGDQDCTT